MTRKQASRVEKELRARGVRKPYVCDEGETLYRYPATREYPLGKVTCIDSYPLTARIVPAFDKELGLIYAVTVNDCTLPRIGQDAKVAQRVLTLGQDATQHVADILLNLHPEAYERAKGQDQAAMAHCREASQRIVTAMAERTVSA